MHIEDVVLKLYKEGFSLKHERKGIIPSEYRMFDIPEYDGMKVAEFLATARHNEDSWGYKETRDSNVYIITAKRNYQYDGTALESIELESDKITFRFIFARGHAYIDSFEDKTRSAIDWIAYMQEDEETLIDAEEAFGIEDGIDKVGSKFITTDAAIEQYITKVKEFYEEFKRR